MKRVFCDRCDADITTEPSSAVSGVFDANEDGDGTVTDDADLCRACYEAFRVWLEGHREPQP